jgi:hypothetical protein
MDRMYADGQKFLNQGSFSWQTSFGQVQIPGTCNNFEFAGRGGGLDLGSLYSAITTSMSWSSKGTTSKILMNFKENKASSTASTTRVFLLFTQRWLTL